MPIIDAGALAWCQCFRGILRCWMSETELLREKAERNELRARDAEARLRIIEAEIRLIEKRKELLELKNLDAVA